MRGWMWLMVLLPLAVTACAPGGGEPATTRTAATVEVVPATRRGPATRPSETLGIRVTGVEGIVQVRESSEQAWRKVAVGITVTTEAEFRIGPRSAVRLLVPPDRTVTLDRMGVVRVRDVLGDGVGARRGVEMPYGRTRYDVEDVGVEHQSELVSPSSTLGIRK